MMRCLNKYALLFFFLGNLCQINAESVSKGIASYPHLCQLAAVNDEVFKDFKWNPVYRQIVESVSYENGLLYLDIIRQEYPESLVHFDDFRQNDILGSPITYNYGDIGYFSPTTLRYIKCACDLKKQFGDLSKMHIVEIGGGYGGQCKIIAELAGFASYTIIDLAESNALAKKYLDNLDVQNVSFIDNDHLSEAHSYDLVISNFSFSEMDIPEQKKYIEHVIKQTPNGYMTMNFISNSFLLQSHSIEELVRMLYNNGRRGKVEAEKPTTHPDNLLVTWYTYKDPLTPLQGQSILKPSSYLQAGNAITYSFSGGRLGDNLVSYFHARWLSYKYGLPFLYKPFPDSENFYLHGMDQTEGKNFSFKYLISIAKESNIHTASSSSLFIVPYFPETRGEYEWIKNAVGRIPFFSVDWEDPNFAEEVKNCLQPKQSVKTLNLPSDCITVALHLRRGHEAKNRALVVSFPLKFASDEYYINQIRRVATIFPDKKLYIYIFTDDENPQAIVKKYHEALKNPNIDFDYGKNKGPNSLLEDFYSISKFNCCILCQSNFSVIASKLGNYTLLISPVHASLRRGKAIIDEVELKFNGQ